MGGRGPMVVWGGGASNLIRVYVSVYVLVGPMLCMYGYTDTDTDELRSLS